MITEKPYMEYITTGVPSYIYDKAYNYAINVTLTKDDVYTNQYDFDIKVQQSLYSKMCEYAAYDVLKKYSQTVTEPDYSVHKRASWDADLKNFCGVDIAVKSQTIDSINNHGVGWTFQDSKERHDVILDLPHSWVCFVLCGNIHKDKSLNCVVLPLFQMKDLKFRLPRKTELRQEKIVVDINKLQGIDLNKLAIIISYL